MSSGEDFDGRVKVIARVRPSLAAESSRCVSLSEDVIQLRQIGSALSYDYRYVFDGWLTFEILHPVSNSGLMHSTMQAQVKPIFSNVKLFLFSRACFLESTPRSLHMDTLEQARHTPCRGPTRIRVCFYDFDFSPPHHQSDDNDRFA
jgi:hypothetical protein